MTPSIMELAERCRLFLMIFSTRKSISFGRFVYISLQLFILIWHMKVCDLANVFANVQNTCITAIMKRSEHHYVPRQKKHEVWDKLTL